MSDSQSTDTRCETDAQQWRIHDCPKMASFSCPKIWLPFFSRHTLEAHIRLNSTPLNLSLLPQPPFPCHPTRFTSPNSAPSLQELLQKISLSLRGLGVHPNPTNPLESAPGTVQKESVVNFVWQQTVLLCDNMLKTDQQIWRCCGVSVILTPWLTYLLAYLLILTSA